MKKYVRLYLYIAITFFSSACFAKVTIGEPPDADLGESYLGEPINVSDYLGKVVLISFWATWCAPCMKELPILAGMQKLTAGSLQVLAINYKDQIRPYRKIVEQLLDTKVIFGRDPRGRIGKRYGVKGVPHLVIVGRDGLVKAIHVGYKENDLPKLVEEINGYIIGAEAEQSKHSGTANSVTGG